MPVFRYKAVSGEGGEILQGVIEADSREAAIARLQGAGHLPLRADPAPARRLPGLARLAPWRRRARVGQKEVMQLTRELATLLQAGLPLDHALRTLGRLKLSAPARALLAELLEELQGGASLADALAAHEEVFDRLYVSMVRAGETSGALDVVVKRLAEHLERAGALRAALVTAMIYPAILLGFTGLSLVVLLIFVAPAFSDLFTGAEHTLPLVTQAVFALSALLRHYWWGLGLVLAVGLWSGGWLLANPENRLRFDAWRLRLPILGELTRQLEMARFARTLAIAMNNGVPLLTGIRLVREVVNNRVIVRALEAVLASLEEGQSMAGPLQESGVCPELAVQLIKVGEDSGQLEPMLGRIADTCDAQAQTGIKRLLAILEPLLILVLGGLIAIVIISMLLAVYSLNDLVT